jgi:hypothetical protein
MQTRKLCAGLHLSNGSRIPGPRSSLSPVLPHKANRRTVKWVVLTIEIFLMKSRRMRPYWRRIEPSAAFDIRKLRPHDLRRGKRFETVADVSFESIRSEKLLRRIHGGKPYSVTLQDCREGHYNCEQTYCPKCARIFRRYIIGELLRLQSASKTKTLVLVVLLEVAPRGKLRDVQIGRYRHSLRKRLVRAGLNHVPILGGFEVAYRARSKEWVLHINLVVFGGCEKAIARFADGFADEIFYRQVERVIVKDAPEQLSYVAKLTTYHRPHQQHGPKKAKAVPLNASEHSELVGWMSQYEFTDHLFLYNARRRGALIEISSN